jgi:heme-degrading monooxygenase HmoA
MTFAPPYYAVIFVSRRTPADEGYSATADRMEELARSMPGYLGIDSVRDAAGLGITVSYWRDEEAIAQWRAHAEHRMAQERGQREWYATYDLHVARVERSYGGPPAAARQ